MPSIKQIGDLIVLAFQNLFWWLIETLIKILVFLLDFIATLLPSYDIDLPSVIFGNYPILQWLDWVFPVQHFMSCVTIIATNLVISFGVVPFLRFAKVSK